MRLVISGVALSTILLIAPLRIANAACMHEYEEILQPSKLSPIDQLKQHLVADSASLNRIETQNGRVVLRIDSMDSSEDLTFMKLTIAALKKGEIDEIVADVQGPKVLPLLNRMRNRLPPGKSVVFRGRVSMSDLFERMGTDLAVQETGLVANLHRSRQWTMQDQIDFFEAIKGLKIQEACTKIHGTSKTAQCGAMNFVIYSERPDQPEFSRAD